MRSRSASIIPLSVGRSFDDAVARTSTIQPLSGYTIRAGSPRHDPRGPSDTIRAALLRERFPDLQEGTTSRSIAQPAPPGAPQGHALVTLDGRYHIVERIASGGMGEVFRARDTVLAREVAIKVLHRSLAGDQAFIDRFRTEARAAAGLSHSNIVAVFDWGAVDGIYYMVMEYVRGQGLRALLSRDGRLEPAQAAEVVRQTLLALEHAHRQGIVHRDVKPENILVTTEGVVKVADFGLARAYAEGRQTQAGTVTGTVQYLAPEQICGEPADPRSDLYSLGIVTYELLTGKLPFTGETAMSIAYKHLSGRVPSPSATVPAIPAELDGFVASATDRDRELRPESAVEMRRDLEAIAPGLPSARALSSIVDHSTEVASLPPGATTDVVRLGEATDDVEVDTTTQTIARVERTKRRWRKRLGVLTLVAALGATAWGVWTNLVPHRADVPVLVGTPLTLARDRLSDLGFAVRIADGQYSDRIGDGRVLRVQPEPGTSMERGETVTIVPSLGPPPVRAPKVEGMTLERATAVLGSEGLDIAVAKRRFDDELPEGSVVEQLDTGMVPSGSTVEVVISRGHAPVEVPRVAKLSVDEATELLQRAGFAVVVEDAFSNAIDRGLAIGVSPRAGSEARYGSTVTLKVSLGPERFQAPSFIGLTRAQAEDRAAEYGLQASFTDLPGGTGVVITQSPAPGVTVSYGDTVQLFLL
ncbi:MAG: Stk1 family PASTA domain-containing Ser/Thr kinase [Actinomycetota bacterium]